MHMQLRPKILTQQVKALGKRQFLDFLNIFWNIFGASLKLLSQTLVYSLYRENGM